MLRGDLPRTLSREDVDDVAFVVCVGRTTRGRERRDAYVWFDRGTRVRRARGGGRSSERTRRLGEGAPMSRECGPCRPVQKPTGGDRDRRGAPPREFPHQRRERACTRALHDTRERLEDSDSQPSRRRGSGARRVLPPATGSDCPEKSPGATAGFEPSGAAARNRPSSAPRRRAHRTPTGRGMTSAAGHA